MKKQKYFYLTLVRRIECRLLLLLDGVTSIDCLIIHWWICLRAHLIVWAGWRVCWIRRWCVHEELRCVCRWIWCLESVLRHWHWNILLSWKVLLLHCWMMICLSCARTVCLKHNWIRSAVLPPRRLIRLRRNNDWSWNVIRKSKKLLSLIKYRRFWLLTRIHCRWSASSKPSNKNHDCRYADKHADHDYRNRDKRWKHVITVHILICWN